MAWKEKRVISKGSGLSRFIPKRIGLLQEGSQRVQRVAKVKELSYYKRVARIKRLPSKSGRIEYINHEYNRE